MPTRRGGSLRLEVRTQRPRGISRLDHDPADAIDELLPVPA